MPRERVIDTDIKDLLFSDSFERADGHRLPFLLDGSDCTLMLKLSDGSSSPCSCAPSKSRVPPRSAGAC